MTHVDDTVLTAYVNVENPPGVDPGEKLNSISQLWDGIVGDITFSIVTFVSTVSLKVLGSAVVLIVVPATPVQLRETFSSGGKLKFLAGACQS